MRVYIGPYKKKGRERISVKIDRYDTWSLDYTLALVILPALKAYRKNQGGIWGHLFPSNYHDLPKANRRVIDRRLARLQDEILGKMIAAFAMIVEDDITTENTKVVEQGLRLFGEHYRALWN